MYFYTHWTTCRCIITLKLGHFLIPKDCIFNVRRVTSTIGPIAFLFNTQFRRLCSGLFTNSVIRSRGTMTILCIGDSHVKRFGAYIGNRRASSELFDIVNLPQVDFFGISGGAVNNSRHLETILAAVQHYRPTCLIVHLGGNDLDCSDVTVDSVIYKLVAFLTQIRRQFNINHITVLRFMPRERTRHIDPHAYNARVVRANAILKNQCGQVGLIYWRMKGFTNSRNNIFSDGVHLNSLGMKKYFRQLRGILLSLHQTF